MHNISRKIILVFTIVLFLGSNILIFPEVTGIILLDDQLDQYQHEMDPSNVLLSLRAQSFKPTLNVLTRVRLMTLIDPYLNCHGYIRLSIRSDLNGDDLASTSIPYNELNLGTNGLGWNEFDFEDISVNPGDTYYLIFYATEINIPTYMDCLFASEDQYPRGNAWYSYNGNWIEGVYVPNINYDYTFETYGFNRDKPPKIQMIFPKQGEILEKIVNIKWSASDNEDGKNLLIHMYICDSGDNWEKMPGSPYNNSGIVEWDTTQYTDGEYILLIEAQDSSGNMAHESCDVQIDNYQQPPENREPDKPSTPQGPANGVYKKEYSYYTIVNDPDGDQIYIKWDWDDGTYSSWLGPYDSGATISTSHLWMEQGNYQIKVKARDTHGEESDWSDQLLISLPKTKTVNPIILLLERILEKLSIFELQLL